MLETTGIAEPGPLLEGLAEHPDHGRTVAASRVVTVVDAEVGLQVLERHPEARAQVVTADRLLLSKTDLADGGRIRALHEQLARLNPEAEIASFPPDGEGTAALVPWFLDGLEPRLSREEGEAHGPHRHGQLDVVAFAEEAPLVAEPLLAMCGRLGSALVRAKGFVQLAGEPRRAFLERAGDRLTLQLGEPWPPGPRRSEIVLIGQGLDQASLQRQLWACRAPGGPLV